MNSSLSESVQQLVRPGKCTDVYYPDPETAQKQCFRTIQNTRYIQQFANLSGGSSVFTIPPNNGVQDIILTFEIAKLTAGEGAGLGLNRGWGYALIKQISFRYGGSSQYFLTGQQVLQNTIRKAPNGFARDDLLAYGGNFADQTALEGGAQDAYVWLPLPHTVPTAEGKLPPLPTDLLTQQVQVTVELYPVDSIFSSVTPAPGGQVVPDKLNSASFQVQQVILENQADALARRVDMTSHALSYPIEFTQQEVSISLTNGAPASSQTVTLTGFRSGECKNIQVWMTRDADTSGAVKNPFNWYAPENVVMTYAGEVYARFDKASAGLWNLVNGRIAPQVDDLLLSAAGGNIVGTANIDEWVELPFAQTYDPVTAHSMYMAGKPITNGIVNLSFTMPALAPSGAGETYTLHVSYNYNAVLTFSQGTCDYVL